MRQKVDVDGLVRTTARELSGHTSGHDMVMKNSRDPVCNLGQLDRAKKAEPSSSSHLLEVEPKKRAMLPCSLSSSPAHMCKDTCRMPPPRLRADLGKMLWLCWERFHINQVKLGKPKPYTLNPKPCVRASFASSHLCCPHTDARILSTTPSLAATKLVAPGILETCAKAASLGFIGFRV